MQPGDQHFLHPSPLPMLAELRIMLGEADHQDVRNMEAKVLTLHGQKSSLIATLDQPKEENPSVVAAVSSRGCGGCGG